MVGLVCNLTGLQAQDTNTPVPASGCLTSISCCFKDSLAGACLCAVPLTPHQLEFPYGNSIRSLIRVEAWVPSYDKSVPWTNTENNHTCYCWAHQLFHRVNAAILKLEQCLPNARCTIVFPCLCYLGIFSQSWVIASIRYSCHSPRIDSCLRTPCKTDRLTQLCRQLGWICHSHC